MLCSGPRNSLQGLVATHLRLHTQGLLLTRRSFIEAVSPTLDGHEDWPDALTEP